MQLISMMLWMVAILTILSGIAIFFGSYKVNRTRSAWFFVATIFALIWTAAIVYFLNATEVSEDIVWMVKGTYVSSIFIDVALLGYVSWRQKSGKIITLSFLVVGIILSVAFLVNPDLLYLNIIISKTGNSLVTNTGVFYSLYIAFFGFLVPTVLVNLLKQILRSSSRDQRNGLLVLMIGFAVSGTSALIFNLILPFWTWNLVWVGPFMIGVTILSFYYSILRYRALNLVSRGLKLLSYCVIIASAAVAYMVIFFVIFKAMFRGSTPSTEVITLNFVMILIVLLLVPAMNELTAFIHSLISTQKIDMGYIIEQLSNIASKEIDRNKLALFLSKHLHFEYIGFLIDDTVYASRVLDMDDRGRAYILEMKNPENGIWQEIDKENEFSKKLDLYAVAALRGADGKVFGQMMFGQVENKINFSRQDLVKIEAIINLVALMIDSKDGQER